LFSKISIVLLKLQIPLDAPWDAPKAKEWDKTSMAQWMDKIIWTR